MGQWDKQATQRVLSEFAQFLWKTHGGKKEDYSEIEPPAPYAKNWGR
jgi:hypothetical protein